jgi:hypothetical protein
VEQGDQRATSSLRGRCGGAAVEMRSRRAGDGGVEPAVGRRGGGPAERRRAAAAAGGRRNPSAPAAERRQGRGEAGGDSGVPPLTDSVLFFFFFSLGVFSPVAIPCKLKQAEGHHKVPFRS